MLPKPAVVDNGKENLRAFFQQPVVASFIAGGVAGAVSRTVVSPLERLKILFQVQSVGRNEYKMSVPKALAKMWRDEGWRGFMAGNGTNCIRIVPYSAVQFGAYNVYKGVSSFFYGAYLLGAGVDWFSFLIFWGLRTLEATVELWTWNARNKRSWAGRACDH